MPGRKRHRTHRVVGRDRCNGAENAGCRGGKGAPREQDAEYSTASCEFRPRFVKSHRDSGGCHSTDASRNAVDPGLASVGPTRTAQVATGSEKRRRYEVGVVENACTKICRVGTGLPKPHTCAIGPTECAVLARRTRA